MDHNSVRILLALLPFLPSPTNHFLSHSHNTRYTSSYLSFSSGIANHFFDLIYFIEKQKKRAGPTPHLDKRHTIFGRVLRGMKIVERLGAVAVDGEDRCVWVLFQQLLLGLIRWLEGVEEAARLMHLVFFDRPREDIKVVTSKVIDIEV